MVYAVSAVFISHTIILKAVFKIQHNLNIKFPALSYLSIACAWYYNRHSFGGGEDLMDQLGTVTKGQIINTEENYYICVCNKWDTHIELKVVMTLRMT